MRKIKVLITVAATLSLLLPTESFAQPGMGMRGSGGWGAGQHYIAP